VWWDYTNLTKEKFEEKCVAKPCGSAMQDEEKKKKRRKQKYDKCMVVPYRNRSNAITAKPKKEIFKVAIRGACGQRGGKARY
jgi:hypothetical protein